MSSGAEVLYAGSTSAPAPEPPPNAPAPESGAAVLYVGEANAAPSERADTPAEIAAARAADPVRVLYGDSAFVAELPDGAIPGADIAEWRQVAQDIGATSEDVIAYRNIVQAHLQEPVTVEQHEAWKQEAAVMMQERGYTTADLELARRFVARDPRLHAELGRGFGSHPKVVERMIEMARSARWTGK